MTSLVTALISIHAGHNLMRRVVFEGEVEATGVQCYVRGEALKKPEPPMGSCFTPQNGDDIYQIAVVLCTLTEDNRRRRLSSCASVDRSRYVWRLQGPLVLDRA